MVARSSANYSATAAGEVFGEVEAERKSVKGEIVLVAIFNNINFMQSIMSTPRLQSPPHVYSLHTASTSGCGETISVATRASRQARPTSGSNFFVTSGSMKLRPEAKRFANVMCTAAARIGPRFSAGFGRWIEAR